MGRGKFKSKPTGHCQFSTPKELHGKLVGFQPTSRMAVNQWAGNPLAKELYGGRNFSPGFIEPGLKVQQPDGGVVVIELLMSIKPDACFALAKAKSMIAV